MRYTSIWPQPSKSSRYCRNTEKDLDAVIIESYTMCYRIRKEHLTLTGENQGSLPGGDES